jgi:hypothetical protein
MTADDPQVTIESAAGPLTVRWDLERLRTREADADTPLWEMEGTPPPGTILRVLSAAFEDGRALVVAGLRPVEAEHDAERLGALVIEPDGDPEEVAETLISTEYDSDGLPRRLGLEVQRTGEAFPLRVAADRESLGDAVDGRSVVGLRLGLGGIAGRGLLETISR